MPACTSTALLLWSGFLWFGSGLLLYLNYLGDLYLLFLMGLIISLSECRPRCGLSHGFNSCLNNWLTLGLAYITKS